MLESYIYLREMLIANHNENMFIYLCWLAEEEFPEIYGDLKDRLADLEYTDPDLWLGDYDDTSEEWAYFDQSFWDKEDINSRVEFLDRIIERLL